MSADDQLCPQWLTIGLALIASLAFEVGRADGGARWPIALAFGGIAIATIVVHLGALRLERRTGWTGRFGQWLAVAAFVGTLLGGYVLRVAFGLGQPLELVLVASLRNTVLATAVLSYEPSFRRATAILGTFAIVFSTALTTDPLFYGLVVVFAGLGVCWLMTSYWSTLRGTMLAASEEHRPRRWMVGLPVLVGVSLLSMPLVARDATRALFGIAQSSGGTGQYDPFARDGVGNGDMLVAGEKDIQSFAPIDDAPFLNSHEPSLYDCFDDTYEEDFVKSKSDRAISLPQEALAELKERHLEQTQRANRQFSTLRKQRGATRRHDVESIHDTALLFVSGRVPVHLRLAVYDIFDGTKWHEEPLPEDEQPLRITDVEGKPWLAVRSADRWDEFTESTTHAIKFVNLRSARLPSPANTIGLHIDQVDREDMFRWAQPSIVRLARKRVPPLLVAHTHAVIVEPAHVLDGRFLPTPGHDTQHGLVPEGEAYDRIARLAREWTADCRPGWPRVQRVIDRLRSDYVLDPDARPPRDAECPVAHFLFETKRGPDYQFATAAALMLRTFGYPTRFVTGFHADVDDYDPRTRHTAIRTRNVHSWAEVDIGSDTWVTVEATPGYAVLGPPPTIWQRAIGLVIAIGTWVWANIVAVVIALVLAWLVHWFRFDLQDVVRRTWWRLRPPTDSRQAPMQALRFVEERLTAFGYARPEEATPRSWLESLDWLEPELRGRLRSLVRLAEWAAFAPDGAHPPVVDEGLCDTIVLEDSLHSLRRMARRPHATAEPPLASTTSNQPGHVT